MPSPLPRVSRKGTSATAFGRYVLDRLDERDWTLADLAHRLNRSETYTARWIYEAGPPLALCLDIAFALGLDCRDLLEAAGYPVVKPVTPVVTTLDAQSAAHERAHELIDRLPEAVVAVVVPMLDGLNKWEAGKG